MDNYQPLNNNVIVQILEENESVTEGGVLIPKNTSAKLLKRGKVIAVSDSVLENHPLIVGDIVLVHKGEGRFINEDTDLLVYDIERIISKVI